MIILRRLVCSLLIGLSGAIYAFAFAFDPDHYIGNSVFVAVGGFVGGCLSGALIASHMGRPGKDGWPTSLLAFFFAFVLAGLVGGTLLFPIIGTLAGVLAIVAPLSRPELAVTWLLCWAATHLIMRKLPFKTECRRR